MRVPVSSNPCGTRPISSRDRGRGAHAPMASSKAAETGQSQRMDCRASPATIVVAAVAAVVAVRTPLTSPAACSSEAGVEPIT